MPVLQIAIALLTLTGCQRGCQKIERSLQVTDKPVIVRHYSGGVLIREYRFTGIVNNSEASDGYYFTIGDTLYEVSGDVQILTAGQ